MAILLPLFENTSCRILTVCGRIKEAEYPISGVLPEREPLVAAYQAAGRNRRHLLDFVWGWCP
jgi:hypothetical protein